MIPDYPVWVWGLALLGLVVAACVIILAVVTVARLVAAVRAYARLEGGGER